MTRQEKELRKFDQTRLNAVRKFDLITKKTGFFLADDYIRSSHELNRIATRIHTIEGNDFQEFFYLIFLNQAQRPTGYFMVSKGGVTSTIADPRIIIKAAALADCTSIVLVHNHPSGNTMPSEADKKLTNNIKNSVAYFDIKLLDHIILCGDRYTSFADEGLL